MRTTMGSARNLHLDRAARTAGEAFAFEEPDAAPIAKSFYGTSLLWLAIAAVAVLALSYAF